MGKLEVTLMEKKEALGNVLGFSLKGMNTWERIPNIWRVQGQTDLEMHEIQGERCNRPANAYDSPFQVHGEHRKKPTGNPMANT